jgi:hypothetical protein
MESTIERGEELPSSFVCFGTKSMIISRWSVSLAGRGFQELQDPQLIYLRLQIRAYTMMHSMIPKYARRCSLPDYQYTYLEGINPVQDTGILWLV